MKTLMTVLVGLLMAAPVFVQSANAQRAFDTPARERAIRECNALDKQQNHDPFSSTSGPKYHYKACMAERGQPS